ncbi:MAG: exodeoxyribonuclease VII small subunit [Lachnospiraceae bacterium]|nr:exodeoxyribonuclease VII small subunit [Lachnospiraceae bacterium]
MEKEITDKQGVEEQASGEEVTLEEAFQRLDEIMEALEDRDTSLEDSFRIYQKGMELIRQCSQKIDLVEKKVLVIDEEGELGEF